MNINPQISALRSGCDILVATPGRLLDLAQQRAVDLSKVQVFVLDEADRMLDMGFIPDIRRIIKLLPAKRQNLLFSATYSDDIRALAERLLHDPLSIQVAPRNAPIELVEQRAYRVQKEQKRHLLVHLIQEGQWHQVLIFTRTKHGANRLTQQLEGAGIRAAAIHGNKSQAARVKALDMFKRGQVTALVATEVAARGLDIKELPQVVNYELPNVPEDYVHRIGRTGRAGAAGRGDFAGVGRRKRPAARYRAGSASQYSHRANTRIQNRGGAACRPRESSGAGAGPASPSCGKLARKSRPRPARFAPQLERRALGIRGSSGTVAPTSRSRMPAIRRGLARGLASRPRRQNRVSESFAASPRHDP